MFFFSDLRSHNGNTHLVIAASAQGTGVNIPNIKRVVIFGVPENMESYLQVVGRGERDGSHLCHYDLPMRSFVKNKVKCRHVETVFETVFLMRRLWNLPKRNV